MSAEEEEWRRKVEYQLGQMSTQAKNIAESFSDFLKEERSEHRLINERISVLEKMLSDFLVTAKASNRLKAGFLGIFSVTLGAGLLKLWQYLAKGGPQ